MCLRPFWGDGFNTPAPVAGVSLSFGEPSWEGKKVDLKTSEGQHIDFTLKLGC